MPGIRVRFSCLQLIALLSLLATFVASLRTFGQAAPTQTAHNTLPRFDFTQAGAASEWNVAHDIGAIRVTPEGMRIEISGSDPYTFGPARDYPAGKTLWLHLRLKSDTGGVGQVFYFGGKLALSEENSVHFPVRLGVWDDIQVPLPALGPGTHLRFDPPGERGACVVSAITFAPRVLLKNPNWPKPKSPLIGPDALTVHSGELTLFHNRREWGGFELRGGADAFAVGHTRPLIGYLVGDRLKWLDLARHAKVRVVSAKRGLTVTATAKDADSATWTLKQTFTPDKPNIIAVQTSVAVSRERSVVYLPVLTLLPGLGEEGYGETKTQALFAGLEYLDRDEPSSSEKDIIGPGAKRQVPDTLKITFPLMAVHHYDSWIALAWEPRPDVCALFDSPDRTFRSGGHVMGLLFPGSNGANREEGSFLPYGGARLSPDKPLVVRGTILTGYSINIKDAVRTYVEWHGLPPIPSTLTWQQYLKQTATGWLDTPIYAGDRFRHAFIPGSDNFAPQPAADAALDLDWMAQQTNDANLKARLEAASQSALAVVALTERNDSGVSHIRYPAPALVYGYVEENAVHAAELARSLLTHFEPDGTVHYRPAPGGLDFGRTHFAPDANGLTAQVVMSLLEAAATSGDPDLIRQGLTKLRALGKFSGTVPRGAQTWEVPLHTPDILASAYLVRAYTLGYELTGIEGYLNLARSWAWTGVPFLYLTNPTGQAIGPYASIPVFGATQWKAPNWMGLPVQWCGLVYADALYRLVRHDPKSHWKQIADGITASGIQQSYPASTAPAGASGSITVSASSSEPLLTGLLPDSVNLRPQTRNYAAINPGTVFANAIRFYNKPELYAFRAFRAFDPSRPGGLLVSAPCAITKQRAAAGRVTFTVTGWTDKPFYVLIAGLAAPPRVRINGKDAPLAAPHEWNPQAGRLVLRIQGTVEIEITKP